MRVLITGATGTIGVRLVPHLFEHGHVVSVLSRRSYRPPTLPKVDFFQWDGKTPKGWAEHLETVDAVVHLAGAGIADERWTDRRKKVLYNSRIDSGQALVEAFRSVENKPKVLIQASGIDYYASQGDTVITESSEAGSGFLADLCVDWEASTQPVEEMGVRRAIIRTGIVLDSQGGALPRLIMPFHFFAGGPLGTGRQWFPWIHYLDEVDAIRFLIENEEASGPFNLSAPNPLQNKDLARTIGKVMHRPAFVPAPSFALKLVLGELSEALLEGQRAVPERLQQLGYEFKFPQAKAALQDLLSESSPVRPESLAQLQDA